MLDTVYEYGLRERGRITGLVESMRKSRPEATHLWRSGEIPDWEGKIRIAAVDGSYNRMDFREFILFAIDAECVAFDHSVISTRTMAMVDLLRPSQYARNRLQLYMSMLEMRLANLALEEGLADLVLLDGSLFGQVIRPLPFEREMPDSVRSRVISEYLPVLKENLWTAERPIAAQHHFEAMQQEFRGDFAEAAGYLEYLEHLLVLGHLLKRHGESLIGISKTSHRTDHFGAEVPDLAIFESSTRTAGWSKGIELSMPGEAKRVFPVLESFFRELKFMTYYCRLEDGANVLRLEFPGLVDEAELVHRLSLLRAVSTGGYPYPLRRAHRDVSITGEEMGRLAHLFGLTGRTGREML